MALEVAFPLQDFLLMGRNFQWNLRPVVFDMEFLERTYSFKGHDYKIVYVQPPVHRDLYHASWYSFEDESTVRDIMWDIQPGDCIIDVGAAYGSYSLTALASGAERVFAWSPQGEVGFPAEREFFAESLARNGWTDKATIYGTGIYDRDGWLNTMTQEFNPIGLPPSYDAIQVSRLDTWYKEQFLPTTNPADFKRFFMKLDVEGAEVEVLKSAGRVLTELHPTIQVENHLFKRSTIEAEVRSLLLSYGYREVMTRPYHSVSHSLYMFGSSK